MGTLNVATIIVTQHASERYAERIADKEGIHDVKAYVAKYPDKIKGDIQKMLEHSEHIYHGKVGPKDNVTDVFVAGTWILFVDIPRGKVVTLYKIEFHIGEEFNKEFVKRIMERMQGHKQQLEEAKAKASEENAMYAEHIRDYKQEITGYKAAIKSLESLIADYQDLIDKSSARWGALEQAVRQDVEDLVLRKEF